jgi:hypothetical protein
MSLRGALLLTAVLLLAAAEQTWDAAAGRDECSVALRNQEASRANLRVDHVLEELRAMRADSKADILAMRADSKADILAMRADSKADILAMRADIKADMLAMRADSKADMLAMHTNIKVDMANNSADLRRSFNSWTEGPAVKLVYIMGILAAAVVSFILRNPAKFGALWALLVSGTPTGAAPPIAGPAAQAQAAGQDLHLR